jgi:hypothetical protein
MSSYTKEDRIQLSSKAVGIKDEKTIANNTIGYVDQATTEEEAKDSPNKKFIEEKTVSINSYQDELKFFDGITRTELVESIMIDSAEKTLDNSFFPVDTAVFDNTWPNFVPFAGTHAIGKQKTTGYINPEYPATGARTEYDIISDINSKISAIESEPIPERATGQQCDGSTGFCTGEDNPPQTTQATCEADNGVWTPPGNDTYSPSVTATLLSELKTLVQEWENMLNSEKATIPEDKDSTRKTKNDIAIADINNAISIIDTWQSVQDFDTTTSLPTGSEGSGCTLFYAMIESDFEQAKIQPTTLQPLKNELTARSSYISTRQSELEGSEYLGSINQDINSGSLIDTQGLYGERMLFIDMRLNLVGGTLSKLVNLDKTRGGQEALKESADNAEKGLELVIKATKASADGANIQFLHFENLSGFSAGDRVYMVSDTQDELSGSIEEINGNRAKLTFKIPQKYTIGDNTRLYKLL